MQIERFYILFFLVILLSFHSHIRLHSKYTFLDIIFQFRGLLLDQITFFNSQLVWLTLFNSQFSFASFHLFLDFIFQSSEKFTLFLIYMASNFDIEAHAHIDYEHVSLLSWGFVLGLTEEMSQQPLRETNCLERVFQDALYCTSYKVKHLLASLHNNYYIRTRLWGAETPWRQVPQLNLYL